MPGVSPGDFVQIMVSDTGGGIAPAVRDHIFEPFFTTKDEATSTGLGLATVKSVVTQYGGFIRVSSEPGKGSAFALNFPSCDEGLSPKRAVRATSTMKKSPRRFSWSKMIAMVRDLVATVLKEIGYTVLIADSAKAAQVLFEESQDEIDLLITDVVMPKLSGKELHNLLKEETQISRPSSCRAILRTRSPDRAFWIRECTSFQSRSESKCWLGR